MERGGENAGDDLASPSDDPLKREKQQKYVVFDVHLGADDRGELVGIDASTCAGQTVGVEDELDAALVERGDGRGDAGAAAMPDESSSEPDEHAAMTSVSAMQTAAAP